MDDMTTDPHPWALQLDTLYDHAWQRLTRGLHDRQAPARHPTLATVSPEGWPQARTVVLRAADRTARRLEIHTNLHSPKIDDLRSTAMAALHVWDSGSRLQIRLQADVVIAEGTDVLGVWAAVPERSRTAYSRSQVPGQPIASALAYEPQPEAAAFAVLHLDIRVMDLLHLGTHHRRAQFTRETDWAGQWLAP
jgi:pyridoxamine 5'-phosphate oxidase